MVSCKALRKEIADPQISDFGTLGSVAPWFCGPAVPWPRGPVKLCFKYLKVTSEVSLKVAVEALLKSLQYLLKSL